MFSDYASRERHARAERVTTVQLPAMEASAPDTPGIASVTVVQDARRALSVSLRAGTYAIERGLGRGRIRKTCDHRPDSRANDGTSEWRYATPLDRTG